MFNQKFNLLLLSYFLLMVAYALLSFSLTDPNLVLFTNSFYQDFQNFMWKNFFENRWNLVVGYLLVVVLLFTNYFYLMKSSATFQIHKKNIKKLIIFFTIIISPLIFSYNSLSHDVFNYIFNAKIVLNYGQNPHQVVALDFAFDNWTRFMHNTHTPAPYGYGWTILSLIPYVLGFGKFFLTWMSFRLFSILSILGLIWSLSYLGKKIGKKISFEKYVLLFLNPFFLIEIVSNFHNDLWMLIPAIVSLGLIADDKKKNIDRKTLIISILLFAFSISIKYATIAIFPIWLITYYIRNGASYFNFNKSFLKNTIEVLSQKLLVFYNKYWPTFASILLFLPLLTAQSKYFLPWYLIWSFVWLVFVDNKLWKSFIIIFSVTGLLRYIPWLWAGEFSEAVLFQQKMILWFPPMLYLLNYYLKWRYQKIVQKGIISLKSKTVS